jgi:hypothetical protein
MGIWEWKLEGDDSDLLVEEWKDGYARLCCLCVEFGCGRGGYL